MLFNRNRKDGNPILANKATVYLNGYKQEYCLEAKTIGPCLKAPGYVIRMAKNGRRTLYDIAVEKIFGFVEVRLG